MICDIRLIFLDLDWGQDLQILNMRWGFLGVFFLLLLFIFFMLHKAFFADY